MISDIDKKLMFAIISANNEFVKNSNMRTDQGEDQDEDGRVPYVNPRGQAYSNLIEDRNQRYEAAFLSINRSKKEKALFDKTLEVLKIQANENKPRNLYAGECGRHPDIKILISANGTINYYNDFTYNPTRLILRDPIELCDTVQHAILFYYLKNYDFTQRRLHNIFEYLKNPCMSAIIMFLLIYGADRNTFFNNTTLEHQDLIFDFVEKHIMGIKFTRMVSLFGKLHNRTIEDSYEHVKNIHMVTKFFNLTNSNKVKTYLALKFGSVIKVRDDGSWYAP